MSIRKLFEKHQKTLPILVCVLFFIVFAFKTPSQNVGYGDSDEFLAVASQWGIAHPPGYILYTTMLYAAMKMPIPFTTATFRAHAVSGIAFSIALYFGFISIQNILHGLKKSKIATIASYGSIILLAANSFLFSYAVIAEKYMFAVMFMMALYALLTTPAMPKSYRSLYIYIAKCGLLMGLLLAYHQSFVFFIPYVIYVLITKSSSHRATSFGIFAAGIIASMIFSMSLTYIRLVSHPTVSWYAESSLRGLVDLFARKDFQGLIIDRGTQSNGYIPQNLTLNQIVTSSKQFMLSMVQTSGYFSIILFLCACIYAYKNRRKLDSINIYVPFVLMGLCLISYLGWPTDLGSQATTERFFTFGYVFLLPIFGVGLFALIDGLCIFLHELSNSTKPQFIVQISAIVVPVLLLAQTASSNNLKQYQVVSTIYHSMMNEFDQNALVTCYSDTSCFALLYEQTVLKNRQDLTIIPIAYPLIQNKVDIATLHPFTYSTNPYMLFDIVTNMIGKQSVYAVDISPYYYNIFGIDYAFMYYIPMGYYGKLDRQLPLSTPNINESLYKWVQMQTINTNDLMQRRFEKSLAQSSFTNAHIFLFMNDRNKARIELNNAVNLSYKLTGVEKKAALSSRTVTEQTDFNNQYKPGTHVQTAQSLLDRLPDLYKQNRNAQALRLVMGAITIDPTNVNARLELARIYKKMGDTYYYKTEYLHVLMIDPNNSEAKQELAQYLQ